MMKEKQSTRQIFAQSPEGRFGVRNFWELLIKLIIGLIIVVTFTIYWQSQLERNPRYWIVVLSLIGLLIWLILRQKHFVGLSCNLTDPNNCKHGDAALLNNYVLEPILGTATGLGFSRYQLEVFWSGTIPIADAVIYANPAGDPDATLSIGNHQVNNGKLGFVDIQKAILGAADHVLTSTQFEVRLYVFGLDGSQKTCTTTFSITAARAYIKYIGGGWSHDVTNVNEPLRHNDNSTADELAVGGYISVRGAADTYGCSSEQIAEYSLWIKPDPTFNLPQPSQGLPYDPVADGWTNITRVVYTDNDQRIYNKLNGMPTPNFLTNSSIWSTRSVCIRPDFMPLVCFPIPNLVEFYWNSRVGVETGSGKYSFLLKVIDTAGNTYYDIQRVWIDNEAILGGIRGLAGLGACEDLYILDVSGGIISIEGYATDPLIVSGDLTKPTSDNFDRYQIWFQKQGASGWQELEIPLIGGSYPGLDKNKPVPERTIWSGGSTPPVGVLAEWDLRWLDAATNPKGLPTDQLLAVGKSCTYTLRVEAWDKTLVSEDDPHWTGGSVVFSVVVHNAHKPPIP
jgi:hypothetical protein